MINHNINLIEVLGEEMKLEQLKTAFDLGGLKSAVITTVPMGAGYMLIVKDKDKRHMMTTQRSDKHEQRVFKSIDAAVANAEKIGFKEINVDLRKK
jgi:hypothetical protein